MPVTIKTFLAGMALSAVTLAPAAGLSVLALSLSAQPSFAQGNGNRNGNGNRSANRSSNRNSNAGKGGSHSANSRANTTNRPAAQSTEVLTTANLELEPDASHGRGALASELKGLNAAHANPNAFLHADPDSNVGRIGTYYFASLDAATALEALTAAGLSPEDVVAGDIADQATIETQLAALDPAALDYDPAAAAALLADLGYVGLDTLDPADPDYDAQYQVMLTELTTQATSDLNNDLLYAGYFDALGGTETALAGLLPEGGSLSPEALAELNRLLGF